MGRRRWWHPTPVLLPGKSHGQRSPVGCSPWGRSESDRTERLHFHFSPSCIGEGNGNPLSVLAWRIPGMEEPGGLPSMGSHTVRHDWSNLVAAAAVIAYWAKFCLQLNICYLYIFQQFWAWNDYSHLTEANWVWIKMKDYSQNPELETCRGYSN